MCSSDQHALQLNTLSCRDGAMQHCQQAPVSNEFSTAVLADSVAARGGKLFIQYYSHPRIRHGHLLHSVIWSGGPFSLFDLVSFVYYLVEKAQCTVSLQMHPAFVSRSVSRLPHLALTFGSFSLHQCSRLYIYKDRRTDWPQLLTY